MNCWREWANEYSREVRGVTLQLPEALCTIQQCMCSWARDPWTARNKRALEAWAELRSCKGEASNTLNLVQPEAKTKTHRKKGIRSVAVPGSVSMQCTGLCLSDLQLFQAALDATLQHPPSNTATPSTSWQLQVLVPSQGISCWWQWPLQAVAMKAGGSAGSREGSSCPAAELTRGSLLTPPPGSQDIPKAASRGWVTAPHSHPGCSIMSSHRILPAEETNPIFCLLEQTWAQQAGAQLMQTTKGFWRAEGWTAWWKARLPRKILLDLLPGLQNDSTSFFLGTLLSLFSFFSSLVAKWQSERKNLGDRSEVRVNVEG